MLRLTKKSQAGLPFTNQPEYMVINNGDRVSTGDLVWIRDGRVLKRYDHYTDFGFTEAHFKFTGEKYIIIRLASEEDDPDGIATALLTNNLIYPVGCLDPARKSYSLSSTTSTKAPSICRSTEDPTGLPLVGVSKFSKNKIQSPF